MSLLNLGQSLHNEKIYKKKEKESKTVSEVDKGDAKDIS